MWRLIRLCADMVKESSERKMNQAVALCEESRPRAWDSLAQTLPAALKAADPNARINFIDQQGRSTVRTYEDLIGQARKVASGWREHSADTGLPVLIQLTDSEEIIQAFWGCLFAGLQPIIVPVPTSFDSDSRPVDQLRHLYELMNRPVILSNPEYQSAILRSARLSDLHDAQFLKHSELICAEDDGREHVAEPDDVAFFTLSSGSTGLPKAVTLSHRNMLARGRGANDLCGNQSEDVILSWLPFDHIGNISAYHLSPILCGSDLVYAPKEYVLAKPTRWLDLIDQYRATHTWAPNFAFGLIAKQLQKPGTAEAHQWDLSCVKGLLSAGELISRSTVLSFLAATEPYGLRSESVISAFGMAEVCSGVNYHLPAPGTSIQFAHLDRNSLDGDVHLIDPDEPNSIAFANLGPIIPGMAMRIVDDSGKLRNEGQIGQFQLKGDGLMPGYHRNPEANEAFTEDGWFDTGDAAFILDKDLYLLGRTTLGIVINGVNLSNHDIEAAVEEIDGITPSYTAACAVFPPNENALKLAVFFHAAELASQEALGAMQRRIQAQLSQRLGVRADYLLSLPMESIPKTAIGKIQHKRLIKQFQSGEFEPLISAQQPTIKPVGGAATTGVISELLAVWSGLLPGVDIAPDDSFFELGADSLILMQALGQINDQTDTQLSLVDLFKHPSVAALAQMLEDGQGSVATDKAKARMAIRDSVSGTRSHDIAVIGMAARFPGADSIEEFWSNLLEGEESITFFDERELDQSGFSRGVYDRPEYVAASPLIKDARRFDAEFFGYSSFDAELMDPQQRQFLEVAWEAFEDAGYDPTTYPGSVGIYAGAAMNTYLFNNVLPNRAQLDPNDDLAVTTLDSMGGFMAMVANDKDYLATRTSYKLNLGGPSVNVQTACSTGLVCIHMACQALKSGEADLFLAGCSSIQSPEHAGHLYQPGMIVTPDGHVRSFDANAGGTIFGSGVGAVLLKRLDDAVRDRDHIHAVVKGTAVNNDAGAKVGYQAPSSDGQAVAVAEALAMAKVPADTIGMVEAHGTGTVVGDPIEFDGLRQVYQSQTENVGFCALGSVKTNVGHLQITSGTAGFIKAALAVSRGKIPPLVNFNTPNPALEVEDSPFFFNTEAIGWPLSGPRRAGVNSLGIGGTNAHSILEEPPELIPRDLSNDRTQHVLQLTAKTRRALEELAERYEHALAELSDETIGDCCFTANTGRKRFRHRLSVSGDCNAKLRDELKQWVTLSNSAGCRTEFPPSGSLAFVFTGQGSQYVGMAEQLYSTQPTFQVALDECAALFAAHLQIDVVKLATDAGLSDCDVTPTRCAQPLIFSVGYALAKMWLSWGAQPDYVMGHSLGEYTAACIAGVFSLEDAVELVSLRSSLMQDTPEGGEMWALNCDARTARKAIADYADLLSLAADNAPDSVVISGDTERLNRVIKVLGQQGVKAQKLNTSHAFHSPLMAAAKNAFEEAISEIRFHAPVIPLISNVTGVLASDEVTSPTYWAEHICRPVLFRQSIAALEEAGTSHYLEIGPNPTLSTLGLMCSPEGGQWVQSLDRRVGNWQALIDAVSTLALSDLVDLKAFDADYPRRRVSLPTYPFARTQHWLNPPTTQQYQPRSASRSLVGEPIVLANVPHKIFQSALDPIELPVLRDHLINNLPVVSAAGMMAMMLSAQRQSELAPPGPVALDSVTFQRPLIISPGETPMVQTSVDAETGAIALWSLSGRNRPHLLHSDAQSGSQVRLPDPIDVGQLKAAIQDEYSVNGFLDQLGDRRITLGPSYRWTKKLYRNEKSALAELSRPRRLGGDDSATTIHPGLIDTCFGLLLATADLPAGQTWLPFGIDHIACSTHQLSEAAFAYFELKESNSDQLAVGDGMILDREGKVLIQIRGLNARPMDTNLETPATSDQSGPSAYTLRWAAAPAERPIPAGRHWTIVGHPEQASQLSASLEKADCLVSLAGGPSEIPDQTNGVISLLALEDGQTLAHAIDRTRKLIQALAARGASLSEGFWCITRGAYRVTGKESIDPMQTAMRGLCLSVRREHPELDLRHVDMDADSGSDTLADLISAPPPDLCIAVRGQKVFVEKLSPAAEGAASHQVLDTRGTYVVTGAHGALGRRVTDWLIDNGVKHLLLLGRNPPDGDRFGAARENGVEILCRECDIGELGDLTSVLQAAREKGPALAGIFHCAGQLHDELLVESTQEALEKVLRGKALGARHLDELVQHDDVAHFVMFSSAASVLGNAGQSAYSAANAYLDGLAHARKSRGQPALSVNWGPFSGNGMASEESALRHLSAQGFTPIDDGNLGAWLASALKLDSAQVLVADCDWQKFEEANSIPGAFLSDLMPTTGRSTSRLNTVKKIDFSSQSPEQRQTVLTELVKNALGALLGITDSASLSSEVAMADLGLDSLLAVQLRNHLGAATGRSLPVGLAFNYPSIGELAGFLNSLFSTNADGAHPQDSGKFEAIESAQAVLDDLDELLKAQ